MPPPMPVPPAERSEEGPGGGWARLFHSESPGGTSGSSLGKMSGGSVSPLRAAALLAGGGLARRRQDPL